MKVVYVAAQHGRWHALDGERAQAVTSRHTRALYTVGRALCGQHPPSGGFAYSALVPPPSSELCPVCEHALVKRGLLR